MSTGWRESRELILWEQTFREEHFHGRNACCLRDEGGVDSLAPDVGEAGACPKTMMEATVAVLAVLAECVAGEPVPMEPSL